ncbi:hypothetical protein DNTS_006022 [Danionella cerebrum]|uniref:SEA domain-containing protein n=1 Tax=Danionella cerebrum TaxID=2873325 RepID=A0A553NMQ5_9TELE|nr:hypothetical protein DNTS_006022 [Danionella translucida]
MRLLLKILLLFLLALTKAEEERPPTAAANVTDQTDLTGYTEGPCDSSPCVGPSICEERFGGIAVCRCRRGMAYLASVGCIQAKFFPATLTLEGEFNEDMADPTSEQFLNKTAEIEMELNLLLSGNGYLKSIVLSLRSLLYRSDSIIAEVQSFYDLSSSATSQSVKELFKNSAVFSNYQEGNLCDDACDPTNTDCASVNGIVMCDCKDGYVSSDFSQYSCFPCPNGEKAVKNKCEKCPFGFGGFNCNEPYLLVVVVVSSVLGALLIIFITAFIVVSCRNKNPSSSSQENYASKDLPKPTSVPRIPRANPDAIKTTNNLEMTNSDSSTVLVNRSRPESKAHYSGYYEDTDYRTPVSPAYADYGEKATDNGGIRNPYFRKEDDKIHNY